MIILFNFRLFFKLITISIFKSKGTNGRLTKKRIAFLAIAAFTYIPLQIINGLFLLLDWIFFPGFKDVEVKGPLFIMGNPRTGSTHLLRVLARDEETFATPKLWELVLAPSITQRKIFNGLVKLDYNLGGHIRRWLTKWQKDAFEDEEPYRKFRLGEFDEDELGLLTIFSSIHLIFAFPFWEEFEKHIYFDQKVSSFEKQQIMTFYMRFAQRTLYVHGTQKHYLSKSPANSGRVGSLCEYFPTAKFIYTTRTPLSVIPSTMSLFTYQCSRFSDLIGDNPLSDYVLAITKHWYKYPLERLAQSANLYTIAKYDHLVQDLGEAVREIFKDLGFEINQTYAKLLDDEVKKARGYKSKHAYDLESLGFTKEQIITEYQEVFERFGFDTE